MNLFIFYDFDVSLWIPLKKVENAFCITGGNLADAVRELYNIDAVYRPLNDVEVGGRKLIATSARLEKNILTMRSVINIAPADRELLRKALKTPAEKTQDKKIKDVGARFTCLEVEAGRKLDLSDFVRITEKTIEKIFGNEVKIVDGELSELEDKYAAEYQEKYTSDDWFYANSERMRFKEIPSDAIKTEGLHKAPAGLIRVTLLIRQNRIYDLIITGDFHPSPYHVLRDMEDALRGKEVNILAIQRKIQQTFDRPDVEIAGVEVTDFMQAFTKAFHQIEKEI